MKTLLLSVAALATLSSCVTRPTHEKPIRPTSENSNLAHGSNNGNDGGALGGVDAFSR